MFGIVLAMLNTSACSWTPSAAASSAPRAKPLIRLTTVPAAITALELSTLRDEAVPAPVTGPSPDTHWALTGHSLGGAPSAQASLDPAAGDRDHEDREAGRHD